jgi:hypothetical protein
MRKRMKVCWSPLWLLLLNAPKPERRITPVANTPAEAAEHQVSTAALELRRRKKVQKATGCVHELTHWNGRRVLAEVLDEHGISLADRHRLLGAGDGDLWPALGGFHALDSLRGGTKDVSKRHANKWA